MQAENDKRPCDVTQRVEAAIKTLEDAEVFNAGTRVSNGIGLSTTHDIGYGSNLTLTQTVECDASIMSAKKQDFGSVGSLAGVRNPICVARELLAVNQVSDSLGRIQPMYVLVHTQRSDTQDEGFDFQAPGRTRSSGFCPEISEHRRFARILDQPKSSSTVAAMDQP